MTKLTTLNNREVFWQKIPQHPATPHAIHTASLHPHLFCPSKSVPHSLLSLLPTKCSGLYPPTPNPQVSLHQLHPVLHGFSFLCPVKFNHMLPSGFSHLLLNQRNLKLNSIFLLNLLLICSLPQKMAHLVSYSFFLFHFLQSSSISPPKYIRVHFHCPYCSSKSILL